MLRGRATSHWGCAMSRWGSNATWQRQGACFSGRKVIKSVRHVALEECDVVLGVQRDVAEAGSLIFAQKVVKSVRHVALEECDVVLGVQRDVVEAGSLIFARKRSQNV